MINLFIQIKDMGQGGKYLGQGTYGCAFDPPLLCDREKERRQGIGKFIHDSEEADKEESELNRIKKMDPGGEHTVHITHRCNVSKKNITISDEFDKCTLPKKHGVLVSYDQLILSNKGSSLQDFCNSKNFKINDIFDGLLHAVKGLIMFEKHQFCHCDIKPNNMIRTKDGRILYIDFGLSHTFNQIYTDDNHFRMKSVKCKYSPPEFKLSDNLINDDVYNNGIDLKYKSLQKNFSKIGTNIDMLQKDLKSFHDFVKRNSRKRDMGVYDILYKFTNKIDVFSLGISFIKIVCHDNCSMNDFTSYQVNKLYEVLKNAIHFDPRKRYNPVSFFESFLAIKSLGSKKHSPASTVSSSPKKNSPASNKKLIISGKKEKICERVVDYLDNNTHIVNDEYCQKYYTLQELKTLAKDLKSKEINKNSQGENIITTGSKVKLCSRLSEFLQVKTNPKIIKRGRKKNQ